MDKMIELKNISIAYFNPEPVYAVKRLNFFVRPKEFVSLLGPSGCGKSTTLHAISGFIKPEKGTILIDKREILLPSKNAQIIFQQPHLFPWKNTAENIEFYLKNNKTKQPENKKLVEYYLNLIGLEKFKSFYPHQLSIGMQQRASLARALISNPKIILMDEPFRAIDYQKRMELHQFLLNTIKDLNKTILFVTHDVDEAILLSDRILIMTANPGKIKQEIKINIERKKTHNVLFTKNFLAYKKKILHSLKQTSKNS